MRLEPTPSRPSLQACARKRGPSVTTLAVAQAVNLFLEQAFQALLAGDQWEVRDALAVQIQEIEGEEDEVTCPAFIHHGLQTAK